LEHVPVWNHEISVRHLGVSQTSLTNLSSEPLTWRASFPGRVMQRLTIDGIERHVNLHPPPNPGPDGKDRWSVVLPVNGRATRIVEVAS
jgi:hypothetical protein